MDVAMTVERTSGNAKPVSPVGVLLQIWMVSRYSFIGGYGECACGVPTVD